MLFENRRSSIAVRNHVPLCVLALFIAPIPSFRALIPAANAQERLWITQFGSSEGDSASALARDGARGVFVGGDTAGSLGGPFRGGGSDAFLARYDSAGNRIWITQLGSSSLDEARALAPDGAGGVIVAGLLAGDAFMARYDGAGNRLWITQFGTSADEGAYAIASDGAGGVMVAGDTEGSLGGPNAGGRDVFLARHNFWIRQFGTRADDYARALAPDGAGGVMVAGYTYGNFGGVNKSVDAFLARYDSAGNQLWIRQFGTIDRDYALALATDGMGGVMVAGETFGSLGGPNTGDSDAFLARYDSEGNQLWIRQFGSIRADAATALAPDGTGGVVVAGRTTELFLGISQDVFLAHYDSEGNRLWIRQFGTSSYDTACALAPDGVGGVMVAGETFGALGGPNAGGGDVFLARYEIDSCPCACDFDTLTGVDVCDIIDFTVFATLFVAQNPCACDFDTSTGMGVCDLIDFTAFASQFAGGCP